MNYFTYKEASHDDFMRRELIFVTQKTLPFSNAPGFFLHEMTYTTFKVQFCQVRHGVL